MIVAHAHAASSLPLKAACETPAASFPQGLSEYLACCMKDMHMPRLSSVYVHYHHSQSGACVLDLSAYVLTLPMDSSMRHRTVYAPNPVCDV